jgi:hypothetical protein
MLNNEPMLDLAFHRMVEDSVSSWMVGNSYLGITSGSPVSEDLNSSYGTSQLCCNMIYGPGAYESC